jgi:hypothetical protein
MMLSVSHTAQYQMTGLLVTVSGLKAKTLGHEEEMLTTYRISRPIRRTVIFSLEILEKIMMNVF